MQKRIILQLRKMNNVNTGDKALLCQIDHEVQIVALCRNAKHVVRILHQYYVASKQDQSRRHKY